MTRAAGTGKERFIYRDVVPGPASGVKVSNGCALIRSLPVIKQVLDGLGEELSVPARAEPAAGSRP